MTTSGTEVKRKHYKIQVIGGNKKAGKPPQCYIALPTEWVRLHGLNKGDVMEITYSTSKNDMTLLVKKY